MWRDPSLHPLSREHQHALALCVYTDREIDSRPAAELAARIVGKWDSELRRHFEVEEQVLFPVCARHPELAQLVADLMAEHRQMSEIQEKLRATPDLETVREFSRVLGDHARKEERELFEQSQAVLEPAELKAVGLRLAEALPSAL